MTLLQRTPPGQQEKNGRTAGQCQPCGMYDSQKLLSAWFGCVFREAFRREQIVWSAAAAVCSALR